MFCPHCGARQESDGPKYCLACGKPLTDAPGSKVPEPPDRPESSTPGHNKLLGILPIVAVALGAIALVVGFVLPRPSTDQTDPAKQQPPTNVEGQREQVQADEQSFIGMWAAFDSTDETMTKEWFAERAELDMYIFLVLDEDHTGAYVWGEDTSALTWGADSKGTYTATFESGTLELAMQDDGTLEARNELGICMYFQDASGMDVGTTPVGSDGGGSDSPTSLPQAEAGMQTIGNASVGSLFVPDTWVDRSSDLMPELIDTYSVVYYADPASEFTSSFRGYFDFAKSIQMRVYDTSYKAVASQTAATYQGKGYGELTTEEGTYAGHKAVVITSSIPEDNLNICTILIDRDDDEKNTVALMLNCGPSDSTEAGAEVLKYASSWSR